jgi:hypothetical protein
MWQDTLFSSYRIESNNNNEIWLEIQVEALLRVLKSCEASGKLILTLLWWLAEIQSPHHSNLERQL